MTIPVLMITMNRLSFTKKALKALVKSDCGPIYIFDNASNDTTVEYLYNLQCENYFKEDTVIITNGENIGIAGAMNYLLGETKGYQYCVKCDNDTILPPDFCARMLPHMKYADLVQAKHPIIKATNPNGWEGFTKNMKRANGLLYHTFVGGSGLMFRRSVVNHIPETESLIMGWRLFQTQHPELRKAFCEDVEIELLDSEDRGGYPEEYKEYYLKTGRML